MSLDHTRIEELLAVRSLGALDGYDADDLAQMMADHGMGCAQCRALEDGFAEVAGRMAFALDPAPLDPGMADRILAQPRPAAPVPTAAAPASAPPRSFPAAPSPTPDADELAGRRDARTRGRTWTALIGVAAAVAVLVAVVVAVQPGGSLEVRAAGPSQRIVRFDGEGDVGRLAMAYTPGETGVIFWGSELQDPGPDRVYEIWMIDDDGPVAGGCVVPVDGRIALYVEADVGTTDLMAVTVEPAECPSAPTAAAPVFTAPLA